MAGRGFLIITGGILVGPFGAWIELDKPLFFKSQIFEAVREPSDSWAAQSGEADDTCTWLDDIKGSLGVLDRVDDSRAGRSVGEDRGAAGAYIEAAKSRPSGAVFVLVTGRSQK